MRDSFVDSALVNDITRAVCHYYQVDSRVLFESQQPRVTLARRVAAYLLYHLTGHNTAAVAPLIGRKSHSTVLRGVAIVVDEAKRDAELSAWLKTTIEELAARHHQTGGSGNPAP